MLPNFGTELRQALVAADRRDLAGQVGRLELRGYRYDAARHRTTLRFAPRLLQVDRKLATSGDEIEIPHRRKLRIVTDAAGDIRTIVLDSGTDVAEGLHAFSPLRQ